MVCERIAPAPVGMIIRVLVALLVSLSPALAQQWKPYNELGDLYPAYAIAVSNLVPDAADRTDETLLGDLNGVMGISFIPTQPNTKIKLVIRCDNSLRLFEPAVVEVEAPKVGVGYLIRPVIPFDQARLAALKQSSTAYITYTVTIDGQKPATRTERLRVRSINDCPFAVVNEDKTGTSIDFMFAAYVNEDHPWIQAILQEALQKNYVDAFIGYQGSKDDVYRQAMAIWRVLQERGIRYSSIEAVMPASSGVISQNVRLLDESIRYTQSNCVDGTVLFASILRKIAINPILVVLPGHMFVGFDLDADGREQAYLETTLLGLDARSTDIANSRLYKALLDTDTDMKAQVAAKSFVAALESGSKRFAGSKSQLRRKKEGYALIDIAVARQAGVAPIMYVGVER